MNEAARARAWRRRAWASASARASWCATLTVQFAAGEVVAILGRNGSGKTLTLHTLAGLRVPEAGEVLLDGTPIPELSRRAVALRLGLLPQDLEDAFVTSALATVLIGRHPHLSLWQWESAAR